MTQEIDEEHPDFNKFLEEVCKRVGETARKEAFAAGSYVVYSKDGYLIREYANGSTIKIKKL
jgi:hypothetical protein